MWTMNGWFGSGVLGWTLIGAAQGEPVRASVGEDAALVRDGGRAARVGISTFDSRRMWTVVPLADGGDDLREESPRRIEEARGYADASARVDVLRRVDATWALVQDVHRGGSRMLELLELREDLLEAGERPAGGRLPRGTPFVEAVLAGSAASETFHDLFAPRLVEHEGRLHVVASSLPTDGLGEAVTWIAPVNEGGAKLEGRRIGHGGDARVARFGEEYCLLVRALTPSQTLADAAPVHVYWSGDLRTWQPSLPVDEESPLVDYDLLADSGSLWLVGVVPGPTPVARLWRLDARDGVWALQPFEVELPSVSARVRLLASAFGVPRPKLVLPAEEGRSRVIALPAR